MKNIWATMGLVAMLLTAACVPVAVTPTPTATPTLTATPTPTATATPTKTPVPTPTPEVMCVGVIKYPVPEEWVNMRSGPGTEYAIIGRVYGGQVFWVWDMRLATDGTQWALVEHHASGNLGFLARWLVVFDDTLPFCPQPR